MSEEIELKSASGNSIYVIVEGPEESPGTVILVHGLHDHCGRYKVLSEVFNEVGLRTVRFDLSGHGRTSGLRGYVNSFDDYIADYQAVADWVRVRWQTKLFAYAHSMGALILGLDFLERNTKYAGVVFSSGLFKVNEDLSPVLQKLSGVMSVIAPKLKTVSLDFSGLSRDQEVQRRAKADKLHYTGGVRARTAAQVLKATATIQSQLKAFDFPMLLVHGEDDPLTKYESTLLMHDQAMARDKTLIIVPNARHELFHELEAEDFISTCAQWLRNRAFGESNRDI